MNYSVNPALRLKLDGWRARLLLIFLAGGFIGLAARAGYLQGLNQDFLKKEGAARYSRVVKLSANRGMVLDRNGEPLAVSTLAEAVCANPGELKASDAQLGALAQLLDIDKQALALRTADNTSKFVYLKRQVRPELAAQVTHLKLSGVFLRPEWRRNYPAGQEMAHVLGFTGIDDEGQEGMELAHDESLAGVPGMKRVIQDRLGQVIEDTENIRAAQPGRDLTLSIDRKLQYVAYRELKSALYKQRAKAAGIVVLDVKSGEILALANLPDYNPNDRKGMTARQIRNRTVTDVFEPGSTLKPFTVAVALETGMVSPTTIIETAPGRLKIGNRTIHDAHPHGKLTVTEIVQKSSNIGAAKLALGLKPEAMWQMFAEVGFGAAPKSGFPGEAVGLLRSYKSWRPVEQATMSYGHGISVSLMQLARAYMAFANEGEIKPVTLLKRDHAVAGARVFTAHTAALVRDMLELAVQPGGTAPKAQVPGYRVAGKTGTAHKQVGKAYARDRYVSSFVGFAPVSNPRLLIAVMIDEPSAGEYYGGAVAAPVFSSVMAAALRGLGVTPDAPHAPNATPLLTNDETMLVEEEV